MYRTVSVVALVLLAGCASTTPTYQTESSYVIYDVQPVTIDRNLLLDAITKAVQKHTSQVRVSREIPPAELPEKPGRFVLKDPFANSNMAALLAASGQSTKIPVCEAPLMTIASVDSSMSNYGEKTSFFLCVLPYKSGYHIDIYSTYSRASGGLSSAALGAALARSVVGDSSQFIPRAMNEVRTAAENLGGNVTIVDSYIPESFKGAFIDQAASLKK